MCSTSQKVAALSDLYCVEFEENIGDGEERTASDLNCPKFWPDFIPPLDSGGEEAMREGDDLTGSSLLDCKGFVVSL